MGPGYSIQYTMQTFPTRFHISKKKKMKMKNLGHFYYFLLYEITFCFLLKFYKLLINIILFIFLNYNLHS